MVCIVRSIYTTYQYLLYNYKALFFFGFYGSCRDTEYLLLYLSHARSHAHTHARDACMYVYARQRNATWEGGVVSAQ